MGKKLSTQNKIILSNDLSLNSQHLDGFMKILQKLSPRILNLGLRLIYPFIYFGQWNKKTTIFPVNNFTKFKIRSWTSDKFILWAVWKKKEYISNDFDVDSSDTVVDIGAHIGAFSVYAAKKANRGKIYAYEACKENYALLIENIKLNKLKNITSFNVAVLDKPGVLDFFVGAKNTGGSSLFKNAWTNKKTTVSAISLEDVFVKNRLKKINFLKMDVEGAEYKIILNSSPELLKKIDKIALEFHDDLPHEHNYKELIAYLQKSGFRTEINTSLFFRKFFKMGILKAWHDLSKSVL